MEGGGVKKSDFMRTYLLHVPLYIFVESLVCLERSEAREKIGLVSSAVFNARCTAYDLNIRIFSDFIAYNIQYCSSFCQENIKTSAKSSIRCFESISFDLKIAS